MDAYHSTSSWLNQFKLSPLQNPNPMMMMEPLMIDYKLFHGNYLKDENHNEPRVVWAFLKHEDDQQIMIL